MNAKQRNKLSMLMTVDQVFKTYSTNFSSIPALAGFLNEFQSLLIKIDEVHQIQQGHTRGTTILKLKEEAEMITASVEMAAAMYVYAQVNDIPDLAAKCEISPSYLEKMSGLNCKTTCLNIYNEAAKLNGALSDYGKTPEQINALKKEIDDFAALISSPRSAIVTRSQATQELDELLKQTNDLLRNKVDKLITLLEKTEPVAVNTYKAARVIVDLRAGKQIIDEE